MKIATIGVLAFYVALSAALPSWGQGAGPVGHPQAGGPLPQDLDTISLPITATTTHTQAGAMANALCTQSICVVGTAAGANDAIALRECTQAPMRVLVANISANVIQVYGSSTDTINGIATTTGIQQAKMTTNPALPGAVEYVCVSVTAGVGAWVTH